MISRGGHGLLIVNMKQIISTSGCCQSTFKSINMQGSPDSIGFNELPP